MQNRIEEELDRIVAVLSDHPEGLRIEALSAAMEMPLQRRALQRRLAFLQQQGRIVVQGRGRATTYRLLTQAGKDVLPSSPTSEEDGISISAEGQRIRAYVHQPVALRTPVGYNRDFLDCYLPNRTFYLSQPVREELAALGRPFDGHVLPAGTYARQILDRLLIDLSWNSSRLEGNTYSLLETRRLIESGQVAEGKDARDAQMILNHKQAIQFLVEAAEQIGFDRRTVLNLHALLSDNLLGDPAAEGRLRNRGVRIGGSVYLPLAVPQLIEECFAQILATASQIADPFEQAFFMMVQLPYLQPFEDVNKRVARLSANIPLIRDNLCPLSFVGVSERAYIEGMLGIYELNRIELMRDVFVWAYRRSCAIYLAIRQSLGEPDPFRLRYRQEMIEAVGLVVRQRLVGEDLPIFLRHWAEEHVPEEDRLRFAAAAEAQLRALHEGNFARFRLRPSEFEAWFEDCGSCGVS